MIRLLALSLFLLPLSSFAEMSVGGYFGTVGAEQSDHNDLMDRANTRAGGTPNSKLDSAYEISAYFQYRIDGSIWAFQFRPSFMWQGETGSGGTGALEGDYEYATIGIVAAGLVKIYALESNYLRLYFTGGLNYGRTSTTIQEADFKAKAAGSNLGFQFATGLEVTLGSHGFLLEAGVRKLAIERSLVSSSSGTAEADSVSQATEGDELEFDNVDFGSTLSGVQIQIGYAYYF
jgi:hypothetical protein